jgi:SOS response regulatory protein OraA/RecX
VPLFIFNTLNMTQTAYQYSITLLAQRDYSQFKMTSKLKDKGFDEIEISETIDRLIDLNYLRDDEYMRMRVKQLVVKGYANNYIIKKCQNEELYPTEEFIDNLREDQDYQTEEMINRLIEKKLRFKDIPESFEQKQKLKSKILNFLKTKGYSYEDSMNRINYYFEKK